MRISDGSSDVCSSDLDDPSADRGDGRSGARPAARASRRGARKSLCARAGARFRIRDPRFGGAAERRGAASRRCLTEAADGRPSRKSSRNALLALTWRFIRSTRIGRQGETGMTEGTDERVNKGLIALIVAVATIGGFMFGYDSGVITGTQAGLRQPSALDAVGLGIAVAERLPGCAVGACAAGRSGGRRGGKK